MMQGGEMGGGEMGKSRGKSRSRYARNGHRRRQIRKRLMANTDICPICHQPIDKSIKTPDPMSPEVDEIFPFALGGDELDINNCQLVHRHCNQEKGKKLFYVAGQGGSKAVPKRKPRASQSWED